MASSSSHTHRLTILKAFAASSPQELPSTFIWTLYTLAQHFDRTGKHDQALAHINAALEHTPTLVDLYMIKAKILKVPFVAAAAVVVVAFVCVCVCGRAGVEISRA
jgi:N-alpha-acetyltransferase 15/16, NatA auxiliary subunit